jgi:hypothetical protein
VTPVNPNDPSPLPGVGTTTAVTGVAAVLSYALAMFGAKIGISPDLATAIVGFLATGLTSLWHRVHK